ncbi:tetratricopeptide repeat protein [Pseudodesulfovibrio portus]|uniref:Sel1 repeat family protein n=1 Tax=Pseudodesulfovibrio portus TaxID=231439 RepID=A0ABN6RRT8_9BACT|nr:hypothetical protein [Pseudodesulfovibrio portus]BDQ33765.1 hypothetical protein JCM14722_13070 [Pseudodesulfovibrio portus]
MDNKKFLGLLTGSNDAPRLSTTAIIIAVVFLIVPLAMLQLAPQFMQTAEDGQPGQEDFNLAMAYILTDLNDQAAIPVLQRAADAGNPKAMLVLGVMYAKGEIVPGDMDKARSLLEEPARLMFQPALNFMGIMAVHDGDLERAWQLFDDSLERSTVIIYDEDRLTPNYWMGYLYSNKQFSRYNLHAADMYMARAARSGREDMQLRYAAFLIFETMDYGKAIPLLETLTAKDNVKSKALTAFLHAEGYGYEKDCAKAFDLATDCADQGSGLAMTVISDLYRTGCGVPRDPELARVWAEKARAARD